MKPMFDWFSKHFISSNMQKIYLCIIIDLVFSVQSVSDWPDLIVEWYVFTGSEECESSLLLEITMLWLNKLNKPMAMHANKVHAFLIFDSMQVIACMLTT